MKIIFYIVCLIILIAAVTIGSLILFVDPNKLKPIIIATVKQQTEYQLAIEGKLSWSFYPRLAIKVDRMLLSAPKQATPFIDAQDIRIAIAPSQLIHANERLQGNVNIAAFKIMNVHAENVSVDLHWQNNVLIMQPIKASLYGGSLQGTATGSHLSVVPNWRWDMQCHDIRVEQLLEDANGGNSKIEIDGIGQLKMQAETTGVTREQIFNNLNGVFAYSLNDGFVEGIDFNYLFKSADALINKQPVEPPSGINQTAFKSLLGTVTIKNGVAVTKDTLLTSTAFVTKAQGSVGLLSQELDLQVQIHPFQTAKTQWEIPVLISGKMNHPDIRLDTTEIQKLIMAKEIDKLKAKAVEQIQKHIPGKTGEFLQNLFGK